MHDTENKAMDAVSRRTQPYPNGQMSSTRIPEAGDGCGQQAARGDSPNSSQRVPQTRRVKGILILTVGLPRCGKSTWARRQGYPIVSPDAIRLALHGKVYRQESEPMVWAMAKAMVAALFEAGHMTVILDATNITRARREEWLDDRWDRGFEIFPVDSTVCRGNAMNEGRSDLLPIIDRMAAAIEWPSPDELRDRDADLRTPGTPGY